MEDREIEKKLSRIRFKKPGEDFKKRVVADLTAKMERASERRIAPGWNRIAYANALIAIAIIGMLLFRFLMPSYDGNYTGTEVTGSFKNQFDSVIHINGGIGIGPITGAKFNPSMIPLSSVCSKCDGTGRCWVCSGKGTTTNGSCSICNGSGRCYYCSGTGKS